MNAASSISKLASLPILGALLMPVSGVAAPIGHPPNIELSVDGTTLAPSTPGSAALVVLSPRFGQTVTSDVLKVRIRVSSDVDPTSLQVRLNGNDVSASFVDEPGNECNEPAMLSSPRQRPTVIRSAESCLGRFAKKKSIVLARSDGMVLGQNRLRVTAFTRNGAVAQKRLGFDYQPDVIGAIAQSSYLPPAVGIQVAAGGAGPWVTLTTGWPALPADADPHSHAYPDISFPTTNDTACEDSDRYQVLVLDRKVPVVEESYRCFASWDLAKAFLATLNSSNLVIAGTTVGNSAEQTIDTTSIGGAAFGEGYNTEGPEGYLVIGVPGATPGSAYESYYFAGEDNIPYPQDVAPQATGVLSNDLNNNYGFLSGVIAEFRVIPNDASFASPFGQVSSVTVHGNVFLSPYLSYANETPNGFWLLTLERSTLQSKEPSSGWGGGCGYFSPDEQGLGFIMSCGTYYPTGDSAQAATAVAALASDLVAVTPREIAVLTTIGQPFSAGTDMSPELAAAVSAMGGTPYTFASLASRGSAYTLIANGPDVYAPADGGSINTPFSNGVALSSTTFAQQGETGSLHGIFTRMQNGLYASALVSQEDPTGSSGSIPIDYSLELITSAQRIDWPLTDTAGHLAAYHYVSNLYLTNTQSETGSHAWDLRYFYAGSPTVGDQNEYLRNLTCSTTYPPGSAFSQQDYCDAIAELTAELTQLSNANAYLGDSGVGNEISQSVASSAISATFEILSGQVGAVPATNANFTMANFLNLLAGIATIPAAALGPLDVPIAAALLGVTSGALWTGSAAASLANVPGNPPSYETTFDTTLGELQADAARYTGDLVTAYATSLDLVYTDSRMLAAVGAKVADSDSGWQMDSQLTPLTLANEISTGVSRSLYLQVVPQFFGIDHITRAPVDNIDQIGSINEPNETFLCDANYAPKMAPERYQMYAYFGTDVTQGYDKDFVILGGTINFQHTPNVVEAAPTQGLLDILFADPAAVPDGSLNIPADMFFSSSGFMPYRTGPQFSGTACYKIGCEVGQTQPISHCVGP